MSILDVFEESYNNALQDVRKVRENRIMLEEARQTRKKYFDEKIVGIDEELKARGISIKKRKQLKESKAFWEQNRDYNIGLKNNRLPSHVSETGPQLDLSFLQAIRSHSKVTTRFDKAVEGLEAVFQLADEDKACLRALFLMWQPYWKVDHIWLLRDEMLRLHFELAKKRSLVSQELKTKIVIHPLLRQFISEKDLESQNDCKEILERGKPYYRLTPFWKEYSAKAKEIFNHFRLLRPFLSEALSDRVAVELTELLASRGLKRAALVPALYVDLILADNIELNISRLSQKHKVDRFDDYEHFKRVEVFDSRGKISKSQLIDLSIIKIDELFRKRGRIRGKDRFVMRLINAMAAESYAFRRESDVAQRRKDLKRKPLWKNFDKMGKVQLKY